ncbi:dUTP diphosphatase [Corynebacterium lizhenjunii]|uniref:dUTP diphosphatase n=1 Tax=Corynebacterium lizhenjunii TaxID=2709394 RepID=A0A7T0PAF2_9CORY|nr:dUTP diphosphatase [Corynebacterium lizhenjunii]QPK78300.1 dUTP diphosphatase [Corynebacterium lizhenjunii]
MDLQYVRTRPDAVDPVCASSGAAGVDLAVPEAVTVPARGTAVVDLGLAVEVPDGHVGLLLPRSSLGFLYGITLANTVGVIDSDYRGPLLVKLQNNTMSPVEFGTGYRIVQLMIVPIVAADTWQQVDELPPTMRGAGGIGSTGTH